MRLSLLVTVECNTVGFTLQGVSNKLCKKKVFQPLSEWNYAVLCGTWVELTFLVQLVIFPVDHKACTLWGATEKKRLKSIIIRLSPSLAACNLTQLHTHTLSVRNHTHTRPSLCILSLLFFDQTRSVNWVAVPNSCQAEKHTRELTRLGRRRVSSFTTTSVGLTNCTCFKDSCVWT